MGKKPVFLNAIFLLITILFCFFPVFISAQEEGEMQQQQYDNKAVIYYVFLDSKGKYQIGVMGMKGEDKKILTAEGNNWCPSVSFGGEKVAFYSDRSGNVNLWVMNIDGTLQKQLTDNKEDIIKIDLYNRGQIAWAKDDSEILFLSGGDIWQVDKTGEAPSAITKYHEITSFKLNPEVSKILFSREKTKWRNGLYTMLLDGTTERQIAGADIMYPAFDWGDNLQIAYYSNLGLYTISSFGVSKKYLREVNWPQNEVAWNKTSKEGRQGLIAYISDETGKPEIWIINSQGKEAKQVTTAGGFSQCWIPDGTALLYVEENDIFKLNLITNEKNRLTYYFKSYFPVYAQIKIKSQKQAQDTAGALNEE